MLSPEKRTALIKKDVSLVLHNAVGVILIAEDNKSFHFARNLNGQLNVIAIIGPAPGFEWRFKRALLAEIGVFQSRPYHRTYRHKGTLSQVYFPRRKRCFNLSQEQYLLVVPFVFNLLIDMNLQGMRNWKSPTHWVRQSNRYWFKGRRTMEVGTTWREMRKGTRFSFSRDDGFFLRDIYWAEHFFNDEVSAAVKGLAGLIAVRLEEYTTRRMEYRGRKPFAELKGVRDVKESLDKFPPHLQARAIDMLYDGRVRDWFYDDLRKLIGFGPTEKPLEQQMIEQAEAISDPRERLGDIQLRVTTGLDAKKDYIVVEVYPPLEEPKEDLAPF